MKKSRIISTFVLLIACMVTFSGFVRAETKSPDLTAVLSFSRIVKSKGVQEFTKLPEFEKFTESAGNQVDSAYTRASEQDEFPKEIADFILGKISQASGTNDLKALDIVKLALREVDVIAVELWGVTGDNHPADLDFSLRLVVKFEPADLFGLLSFANEGTDYKVLKNEGETHLYSVEVPQIDRTFFFGYRKLKDLDRSVIIFASKQEMIEPKLEDIPAVASLIASEGPMFELTYGKELFDAIRAHENFKSAKDSGDFMASLGIKVIDSIESLKVSLIEKDEIIQILLNAKCVSPENAKTLKDMLEGLLAIAKLAGGNTDLPEEARTMLELLDKLEISQDTNEVTVKVGFDDDRVLGLFKKALEEAGKQINR